MKKLVLACFVFTFMLYGDCKVDVNSSLKIDKELKQKVSFYWKNKGERRYSDIYNLELPYLNFIHTKDWYEDYFNGAPKYSKVEVYDVKSVSKEIVEFKLKIYFPNQKEPVWLGDRWIKVNKSWYHKYNDSPLPKFGS